MRRWSDLPHLARRFLGQLDSSPPASWELSWVRGLLSDAEWNLFEAMADPDRRHAVAVATAVADELGAGRTGDTVAGDAMAGGAMVGGAMVGDAMAGGDPGTGHEGRAFEVRHMLEAADLEAEILLRCALMHDVGKTDARLGPMGRVAATLLELAGLDHSPRLGAGSELSDRLARYRDYPSTGAQWLRSAGSPEAVAVWAEEHHMDPDQWTLPAELCRVLTDADDC